MVQRLEPLTSCIPLLRARPALNVLEFDSGDFLRGSLAQGKADQMLAL